MNSSRLDYIDLLKGVAIFCMVMGHFLSWQWGGHSEFNFQVGTINTVVRDFIYSFHMPLFFFLSGFCFNMKLCKWDIWNCITSIFHRFNRLIIPGLFFIVIEFILQDGFQIPKFPWFLKTLFEIYILNALAYFIAQRYDHNILAEATIQIAIIICLIGLLLFAPSSFNSALDIYTCFVHFPYFFLGTIAFRKKINISSSLYAISLILWIVAFYTDEKLFHISHHFTSFFAIVTLLFLAQNSKYTNRIGFFFTYIGKYTLPIYLYSSFFLPKGFCLGKLIEMSSTDSFVLGLFVQLVLGVIFSLFAILMSLGISRLCQKNSVLAFICLGKKYKHST